MGNLNFKTTEEYEAAKAAYIKAHPEYREAKPIDCLNLVMKKVWAKKILKGEKPLEYRSFSQFYCSRLLDSELTEFISKNVNDEEVMCFYNDLRPVKKIHFYDYGRTWFLDIKCKLVDTFVLKRDDIEYLQKKYGVHDFDDDLEIMEKAGIPVNERPMFFYFVCGEVIDTNLKA